MIEAIIAGLGLLSTLAAWFLNPKRILYVQLDSIYKKLEDLYVKRDKSLMDNDSATLSTVTIDITKLIQSKTVLLKRL